MIESELAFECEDTEEYRLTTRFARVYGMARRIREDLTTDPDRKEPLWFLWKDDAGKQIIQKKKKIGTPVDRVDVYRAVNKIAWTTYQELEAMGKSQTAKDIIDMYERNG